MRIALLSATERASNGALRAEQKLAGRSVLEWQVDLALRLQCERIICLCTAPASELIIAQQRRVEGKGLSFHALRNHLQLTNLVRADDAIFVQLDGLIVDQDALDDDCGADAALQNCIFEISSDHPLSAAYPADFQRIDKDKHWGGVAVLPGECAAALKEMPEDADAVSLLLRIGLQARVVREDVPITLLENNQWVLASDAESLNLRGKALMEANLSQPSWAGPGAVIAAAIVRQTADRWLGAGSEIAAAAAVAGFLVAAILAGIGFAPAGIALASVGAFAASLADSSGRLRRGISLHAAQSALSNWIAPVTTMLSCAVLMIANWEAGAMLVSLSIPLLAIGLSYLAGSTGSKPSQAFWRDNALHLAIFAGAAFFGLLQNALLVFSLGALLQLLLRVRNKKAIM
ncbi:hypothetical protein [Erythrobacter longus]|uniref:hypothetical protein n=1 Tax=Erythrobacter longus TaxID=1044 RepID=UPI000B2B209A|nr:hypothetical protein [Erythrobacter longus]